MQILQQEHLFVEEKPVFLQKSAAKELVAGRREIIAVKQRLDFIVKLSLIESDFLRKAEALAFVQMIVSIVFKHDPEDPDIQIRMSLHIGKQLMKQRTVQCVVCVQK